MRCKMPRKTKRYYQLQLHVYRTYCFICVRQVQQHAEGNLPIHNAQGLLKAVEETQGEMAEAAKDAAVEYTKKLEAAQAQQQSIQSQVSTHSIFCIGDSLPISSH